MQGESLLWTLALMVVQMKGYYPALIWFWIGSETALENIVDLGLLFTWH